MKRKVRTALLAGTILAVFATPARGATTIGQTFTGGSSCGGDTINLQQASPNFQYAAPSDGVITSWSVENTGAPYTAKLKVARFAGGSTFNRFTIVGESTTQTIAGMGVNSFPVRIAVDPGDDIGVYYASGGDTGCRNGGADYTARTRSGDPPVGDTSDYAAVANIQLDVSARFEVDADNDGFGDETQDQCPTDATTQGQCPDKTAPQTMFKSGPLKTDKRKVRFTFRSSEAGSTFRCRLKGKRARKALKHYAPCTSPKKYKRLKPGEYRFFVFATDAAGNADKTPVKHAFEIVKDL